MFALIGLIALLFIGLAWATVSLQLVAKIGKSPQRVTLGRSLLCGIAITGISVIYTIWSGPINAFPNHDALSSQLALLAGILVALTAQWFMVHRAIRANSKRRSIAVFVLWLMANALGGFGIVFVYRAWIGESYAIAANSMAPTLLGLHHETTCPNCQQTLIYSVNNRSSGQQVDGICLSCQQPALIDYTPGEVRGADRVAVEKLRQPQRWDLIVFHTVDPNPQIYIKRLIGLPGETLSLKSGAIWINGEKQTPPPEIAGLHWLAADELKRSPNFGQPSNAVQLKDNEYYVLGDFTEASSDSRFWGPLPVKNFIGVATLRYWPLSRFKFFR